MLCVTFPRACSSQTMLMVDRRQAPASARIAAMVMARGAEVFAVHLPLAIADQMSQITRSAHQR